MLRTHEYDLKLGRINSEALNLTIYYQRLPSLGYLHVVSKFLLIKYTSPSNTSITLQIKLDDHYIVSSSYVRHGGDFY